MMTEAHFCGLASQSSIYGLTSLTTKAGCNKVLMTSSNRKVYCVEYSTNQSSLLPSTREVQFTYIPGGAEIISIDAFNQACHEHDFVVGITFVKCDSSGKRSQYFNIYSDWEPSSECDLDNIAQGCLSLSLDFIPIQLTHAELWAKGNKEMAWLLSGNDCKIHLYREDKTRQSFWEDLTEEHFPEFKNLPSVVFWMDFMMRENCRLTAFGCQNGCVVLKLVDVISDVKINLSLSIEHDGPISHVRLFHDHTLSMENKGTEKKKTDIPVHLAVANSLEVSVVYRDVLRKGLNIGSQFLLPSSNKFDVATCIGVADIDMDGCQEILLGTYGQELLVYKWTGGTQDIKGSYSLVSRQSFPNPILSVAYIDITSDGLKELLVLCSKGLHILQHDLKAAQDLCMERLKILVQEEIECHQISTADSV